MLEAYSLNYTAAANAPIAFDNVFIKKGCTAVTAGDSSFALNKCGVYMVSVDASAAASTTLQLTKDGIPQPQAQGTGTSPAFVTLVQVNHNNNGNCCCESPVTLQISNTVATTLTNVNIVITKVC